jgi:thioredoxin-dependent peroxiredoxin
MKRQLRFLSALLLGLLTFSRSGNAQDLKTGDKAPDFTLQDAYGNNYSLSSYLGKSAVVVYFYPAANTPGCTKEACGIRDSWNKFKDKNIVVLGVSVDSKEKIKKFIDDYGLNFPLLSDESKTVSKTYGVLNKLGSDNRITFIVDKAGNINTIIRNVDVTNHANEVYDLASKL